MRRSIISWRGANFVRLSQIKVRANARHIKFRMERFFIFRVDKAGHALGVEEIQAASEQDAVEQVAEHYACSVGTGFEIWRDERCVYSSFQSGRAIGRAFVGSGRFS